MKKYFFLAACSLMVLNGFSQSDKYQKTMMEKVAAVDSTMKPDVLMSLSATFERIGDAEKTQWLPYYYAALTQINSGYMMMNGGQQSGMADKLDPVADKAEGLLNKAEALSPNNSEIFVVKKMIANIRMWADPMNRYMKYGPVAAQALEKAKELNPENPRVYLLEGEDKLYTPEQFGGSKKQALALFGVAMKKYEAFKPASAIEPAWGKGRTAYDISKASQ